MGTTSLKKLKYDLEAAQGQLDFYDGLHEGPDPKVRKALISVIADTEEKIRKCKTGQQQADA